MIVKVCGIKYADNIRELCRLRIDMVGLNFYAPSSRYVGDIDAEVFDIIPRDIKRVGVFVNEAYDNVLEIAEKYKLNFIQLHGDESAEYGRKLSEEVPVIKVARIREISDLSHLDNHGYAALYLLDTYTSDYGGSGKKFDWNILNATISKNFLLSGGIAPEDADVLLKIDNPHFIGVDINSRFEEAAARKDVSKVSAFLDGVR